MYLFIYINSTHPRVPERVGRAPGAAVSGGEGYVMQLFSLQETPVRLPDEHLRGGKTTR